MVSAIFSRTYLWVIVPQQRSNYNQRLIDHNQFSKIPIIISNKVDRNQQRNEESNLSISISDRNCATVPRRPHSSAPRI